VARLGEGSGEVLTFFDLGSSASFSEGPYLGDCLGKAILLETGVWRVVFWVVVFLLGLGWAGGIKGDPCSVEAVSDSLICELSAEEPVSSIRIGSCFKGFTDLGALEVLCEAVRKDFLVDSAVGFMVEGLGCEGESEGFDCMARNFRTRGRSVCPLLS